MSFYIFFLFSLFSFSFSLQADDSLALEISAASSPTVYEEKKDAEPEKKKDESGDDDDFELPSPVVTTVVGGGTVVGVLGLLGMAGHAISSDDKEKEQPTTPRNTPEVGFFARQFGTAYKKQLPQTDQKVADAAYLYTSAQLNHITQAATPGVNDVSTSLALYENLVKGQKEAISVEEKNNIQNAFQEMKTLYASYSREEMMQKINADPQVALNRAQKLVLYHEICTDTLDILKGLQDSIEGRREKAETFLPFLKNMGINSDVSTEEGKKEALSAVNSYLKTYQAKGDEAYFIALAVTEQMKQTGAPIALELEKLGNNLQGMEKKRQDFLTPFPLKSSSYYRDLLEKQRKKSQSNKNEIEKLKQEVARELLKPEEKQDAEKNKSICLKIAGLERENSLIERKMASLDFFDKKVTSQENEAARLKEKQTNSEKLHKKTLQEVEELYKQREDVLNKIKLTGNTQEPDKKTFITPAKNLENINNDIKEKMDVLEGLRKEGFSPKAPKGKR